MLEIIFELFLISLTFLAVATAVKIVSSNWDN